MTPKNKAKFLRIAIDCLNDAKEVDCSPKDFLEGLETIADIVSERLSIEKDHQGADY